MNDLLIEENVNLTDSGIFVGYIIMKELKDREKLSIFDLYDVLRAKVTNFNYQNVMNGLVFLNECGLIEFKKPYLHKVK